MKVGITDQFIQQDSARAVCINERSHARTRLGS